MILGQLHRLRVAQSQVSTPFISRWETTTASELITIPMRNLFTYNITVNWGDGSADTIFNGVGTTTTLTHTYVTAGIYDITITANSANGWKGVYFNNTGDKLKIKDIVQWGNSALGILNFHGCNTLTGGTATDKPNLSVLTTMQNAFSSASSLNITNWSSWKPYLVSTFASTFRDINVNGGHVSWITANTTNITGMYLSNDAFNQNFANANIANIIGFTLFNSNGDGWSVENYSNTLIGWGSQTPLSTKTFDAGNVQYNSSAVSARGVLTGTYSWTINDNGLLP